MLDVKNIGRPKKGDCGWRFSYQEFSSKKDICIFFICTIFIEDAREECLEFNGEPRGMLTSRTPWWVSQNKKDGSILGKPKHSK